MRDEIQRISKLVAEGKLSPEDAADLIDAFYAADRNDYGYEEPAAASATASAASEATAEPGAATGAAAGAAEARPGANRDPLRSIVESIEKLTKEGIDSVNWSDVSKQARTSAKKGFEALRAGIEDISKGKVHINWPFTGEMKEVTLPLGSITGKTLKVENLCGNVKIVGNATVGSAIARARFKGQSSEDAKAKADAYSFIIEEGDHMVVIRQPDVSGLNVDLEINMPGRGMVEVRAESGNVDVLGTGGGVRVTCRSGNVTVRGADGVVEITDESGNILIEDTATPSLTIENKNGNVVAHRVRGNINARSTTGSLELTDVAGKIIAVETVSGEIEIELLEPVVGSLNARTVSGNAMIAVPDGSDCRVTLSTLRGNLTCGLELKDDAKQDKRITGRLGSGTGTIDVSAITGNVSLSLRNAVAA